MRRACLQLFPAAMRALGQGMSSRDVKPQPRGKPSGLPFHARFTDVAREAGLRSPTIYGGAERKAYIGFRAERRQALHNESAAGAVAGDFDRDGWVDLAVSNHVSQGDHHFRSRIFWNRPDGFSEQHRTELPTVGPHMMTGVDQGNIYTRQLRESYLSEPHDAGAPAALKGAWWEAETPFGSRMELEVRGANSRQNLAQAPWTTPDAAGTATWWQYRLTLWDGPASSPRVKSVSLMFR